MCVDVIGLSLEGVPPTLVIFPLVGLLRKVFVVLSFEICGNLVRDLDCKNLYVVVWRGL